MVPCCRSTYWNELAACYLRMHGLNGDISFFSFGTWVWHPVLLALNFGCWISQHCGLSVLFCRTVSVKLSFLDLEMIGLILIISSFVYFVGLFNFWSASFVLFSSSDMQYIRGSGIGLRCDRIPILKAQDAHLETLTLTLALNSDLEFGFRIFSCGFIQLWLWIQIFF
ncbi:uncharacterized protein OCT59_012988 [Rhizophagus irregularis]|uniref:uncharacterized protein n=1 Tax=Rhizophagus irregularis TaxID=588596 RepID=UPI003328A8CC|nr:hypothetical protein OCT59_012988 [Rhizophagus irregularis]